MKKLIIISLLFPNLLPAQGKDGGAEGINWIKGLSFEQITQKAKAENKYVFLDLYATWCGPCKTMDNEVYPVDSVGDFMNSRFLSVRVQMDRTGADDAFVQSWYEESVKLGKTYHIDGYPSFIFINPNGEAVLKEAGGRDAGTFLKMVRTALEPGKLYIDPYKRYNELSADFENKIIHYDELASMVKTAMKINDPQLGKIVKTYVDFMQALPVELRYTKQNIEAWTNLPLGSGTRFIQFFYKDAILVDSAMGRKGFAADVLDRSIMMTDIGPFFEDQAKGTGVSVSGSYITGNATKEDTREADWKALRKLLGKKFDKPTVERNILSAKAEWYKRHFSYQKSAEYSLRLLDYITFPLSKYDCAIKINYACWDVFSSVTDSKLLEKAKDWAEKAVAVTPGNYGLIDTYANLLYKIGRSQEAIEWEQKAVDISKGTDKVGFQKMLDKMKNGEKTW